MISVVIPAHDEERVIRRCLEQLVRGSEQGELEIVVVANGCSDDTAAAARAAAPGATVLEIGPASKPAALNVGDTVATGFPRFYIDADVTITIDDVRRVADALSRPGIGVAAPHLVVDVSESSFLVKAYYRIWTRLSWVTGAMVGSGFYAFSESGRARFGEFPETNAEDLWVSAQFAPSERCSVDDAEFTVPASRTIREVIRRRSRIHAANELLRPTIEHLPGAQPTLTSRDVTRLVRAEPRLLPSAVVFAAVSVLAHARGRRKLARDDRSWDRDERR